MLLPGVSGSFVLLILRKYAYVFDGIGRLDPGVIIPFGIGVVLGLMAFSRLLAWLLRKWQRVTLLAICGGADRLAVDGMAVPGAPLRDRARQAPPDGERAGLAGRGR